VGNNEEDTEKSANASWTDDMTTTLVRKMLDMKRAGRQSNNGWKKGAWNEACKTLNKRYDLSFTTDKLKNKMNSVWLAQAASFLYDFIVTTGSYARIGSTSGRSHS
jgi:hypothetical protein